jgi:general secretion pathway protein B
MSFLLEALKKSEEQQRRGEIPGIHSAILQRPERRQYSWALVVVVVLLLLVIAWLSWRNWVSGESGPDGTAAAPVVAVAEPAPVPQALTQPQPQQRSEQPAVQQDRLPVVPRARSETEETGQSPRTPVEKFEGETASWAATPAATSSTSPPTDEAGGEVDTDDSRASLPAEDKIAQLTEQATALTPAPAADQQDPGQVAQPHRSEPVSLWQLPDSVRSDLPALRMSVLVYAERADDRFVLVNGERLKQGDELVAGLEVEEIRRDGVVFTYELYRFLLRR